MNKKDAVKFFVDWVLPGIQAAYESDGKPDWIARSEGWNDFTDGLCKDGEISTEQYENWDHPECCLSPEERIGQ